MLRLPTMAKQNLLISVFLLAFSALSQTTHFRYRHRKLTGHTRPFTPYIPHQQCQTPKHQFEDTAEDAPSQEVDGEPTGEEESQSTCATVDPQYPPTCRRFTTPPPPPTTPSSSSHR
jgi:hypothetical protein